MNHVNALLLAAGLSTRLKDLSAQLPKPLLPVCDLPLLRWAAALCRHHGLRRGAVNMHHLGGLIQGELARGAGAGLELTPSPEDPILGTGGGIKRMAGLLPRATCLVMNAKIVCDVDLAAALALHRRAGALATMVLRPHPQAERWGAIGVDPTGRVTRILDDGAPGAGPGEAMMFTGIHILEPEFIAAIPEGPCCVIRTAYRELLREGAPMAGYVHRGYFYEHSTPARYLQGNLNLLRGVAELPAAPGPLSGVHPEAQVEPGAVLREPVLVGAGAVVEAGATVGPEVVLGRGSRVRAGAVLSQSVVWAGAEARGTLERAVVTPRGALQIPDEGDPFAAPR